MTYREAVQAFENHFPQYMIDNIQQDFDDEDDIVWWSCEVCELNGLLVATAQMPEHWPEIHTEWCS